MSAQNKREVQAQPQNKVPTYRRKNHRCQSRDRRTCFDVDQLRRLADEIKPFRSLLIRHEQVLFAQSQQSAACNASHKVEARMCRWLLHMRDLAGNDDLTLTQDFLAQMLSVRRPSVSIVASPLQKAGLIKYSRGNIQVLDAKGLQKRACECYGTVKAHYQRLLSN